MFSFATRPCGNHLIYSISESNAVPPPNNSSLIKGIFLDTDPSSLTFGQVVVEVDNTQLLPETTLYIHATNQLGTFADVIAIRVKVRYVCELFDVLLINEAAPDDLEFHNFPVNLIFNKTLNLLMYENQVKNFTAGTSIPLN
jgi:hypothetical protein